MPIVEFECNDLEVIGKTIYVKRGSFQSTDYRCGEYVWAYKVSEWTYEKTGQVCAHTKRPIWKMKRKKRK